jgi:hypothetical protein
MVFLQHPFYLLDGRRVLSLEDLVSEAADSIWPGMFQAEAGRGNTASVRSTRDAIRGTVGQLCHIRGTRDKKNALDNRQ